MKIVIIRFYRNPKENFLEGNQIFLELKNRYFPSVINIWFANFALNLKYVINNYAT